MAQSGNMEHSPKDQRGDRGENLAMTTGQSMTCKRAVDLWYAEIKDYDYKKATFDHGTGKCTLFIL